MTQITPLQRLIFHLNEASTTALELIAEVEAEIELKGNTEFPMDVYDISELYDELDALATYLMEYETNLPTDNN